MGSEWETARFESLMQANVLQIGDGYRAKDEELGGTGVIFLGAGHVHNQGIEFQGVERFHANLRTVHQVSIRSQPGAWVS